MSTLAICLYSKYSQRCKEFLDEMGDDLDVQMVPIDNRRIRDTVLQDNQGYHVKTVPCIFLLYPNGRLEKYEGSDAFVWLRKVKEALDTDSSVEQPSSSRDTNPISVVVQDTSVEAGEGGQQEGTAKSKVEQMMDSQNEMREKGSDQFMTKKNDNIKELAQAMQRQREVEEDGNNSPPPLPTLPIDRP